MPHADMPLHRPRSWLPSVCQVCGAWPTQAVCGDCLRDCAPDTPRCPRCGSSDGQGRVPCRHCWPEPSALDAVWASVDYAYPWSGLIARFKFRQEVAWAHVFAQIMLTPPQARARLLGVDWLVPMPMTPQRLAERGYHQAWALTQALLQWLPTDHRPGALPNALVRLSDGEHQHALPRAERWRNPHLRCVVHPDHASRLLDAHVLLIDDVCTTGASLHAAAQALRQAGVARVSAWAFARTAHTDTEPPL